MTACDKALNYAKDVVSGKLPNCKWVRLACQRFLDDLERQNTPGFPYLFDTVKADRAVKFMEKMPHIKGKWATDGGTIVFEPWQCFIECNIFGWVHATTKKRRFRVVFELIPRKNAKSTKAAARGIYLFAADGETGAEIYSGATSEKQAFEVYRPAWEMVKRLPELCDHFGIEQAGNPKNPGTMFVMRGMSKFEVMIGKPGDGASPHAALIDEYHEHDTDHMVETMQTGMGAREQPLLCVFTTAGSNLAGPCYEMQQDMQRILERVVVDETVFCIMFGIDPEDRWDDPKSLIKANPNYGVSVYEDFLLSQLEQAKRSSSKQNAFRTKHLNEWVGAKTAWMNMMAWMRQIAMIDEQGNIHDAEAVLKNGIKARVVTMDDFKNDLCHVAVDLSSKKDTTAVDITFRRVIKDENHYFTFKKFFVPEAATEENEKYKEFSLTKSVEITEGFMTDQEAIEDFIIYLAKNYKIIDVAFDEWNADYMMTRLQKQKINVVKFPFRTQYVSQPMKNIEALTLDGKYWHENNPMMNWMMANVAAKPNIKDDIYPNKARVNDEKCKIDGVAVAIMSMGRWQVEDGEPQPYEPTMFFM